VNTSTMNWSRLIEEAVKRSGLLLEAYTAFHNYSVGNQVLALVQCEERGLRPGPLSTYQGWLAKGRQVQRGERALVLCMPLTIRNREKKSATDPDAFVRFAYKPRWFVLSQTEGDPVEPPATPEWSRGRALQALGVAEVPFEITDGNTQGYARRREIAVSPLAPLPHKTTFHELAHVLLGHTSEADFDDAVHTPRNLREVEAECVALICCEALGLDGADYARGYVQHWHASGEPIPEASAQKIFRAADQVLKAGAPEATAAPTETEE
jgi:hypothetical protein